MSDEKKQNQQSDDVVTDDVSNVSDDVNGDAEVVEIEAETSETEFDAPEDAAEMPESQAQNKPGAGVGRLFIAAVLGGVATIALSLGGGYYALKSNNLGAIGTLINDGGGSSDLLEEQYTDLSTRILSLEGEHANAGQIDESALADLGPVAKKIASLEGMLNNYRDENKKLAEQLFELQQVLDNSANVTPSDDFDNGLIAAMQAQIAELKKATSQSGDADVINRAISDAQMTVISDSQNKAVAIINDKIAKLDTALNDVKSIAQNAAEQAVAAGSGNTLSNKDASNMASALAVAALERALQDERPFEVELNALNGFVKDGGALAQLGSYAKTGLASEVTLFNQFESLLEAALVADLKGDGKSVLDKFIGNAKSIISIRRTGNIEGDETEAVLARIEVAVMAKDLSGAVAQADGLKGPAKAVFATWVAGAKSRLAAKDLMRQVSSDILTSLSE